eukprot:gene11360-23779_t
MAWLALTSFTTVCTIILKHDHSIKFMNSYNKKSIALFLSPDLMTPNFEFIVSSKDDVNHVLTIRSNNISVASRTITMTEDCAQISWDVIPSQIQFHPKECMSWESIISVHGHSEDSDASSYNSPNKWMTADGFIIVVNKSKRDDSSENKGMKIQNKDMGTTSLLCLGSVFPNNHGRNLKSTTQLSSLQYKVCAYNSSRRAWEKIAHGHTKTTRVLSPVLQTVWDINSILSTVNQDSIIDFAQQLFNQKASSISPFPYLLPNDAAAPSSSDDPDEVRIVFVGDSLIHRGQIHFGMLNNIADELSKRHPNLNFKLWDKGISGNRINDIRIRLDRDVFVYRPHAVVVYWDSDAADVNEFAMTADEVIALRTRYEVNLVEVLQRLQAYGAEVFLSGPTVQGERPHGQNTRDVILDAYRVINKRVCRDAGVRYIDSRAAFFEALMPSQMEFICGLPTDVASFRVNPVQTAFFQHLRGVLGFSSSVGCWASMWMAQSVYKIFDYLGRVTVDGEHQNDVGSAIISRIFVEALDAWLQKIRGQSVFLLDNWQGEIGDLTFATSRFPDPKVMMDALRGYGVRVILTAPPFASTSSMSYSRITRHLWIHTSSTTTTRDNTQLRGNAPQGSKEYVMLNVSNSQSMSWFHNRLVKLRKLYYFDGFLYTISNPEMSNSKLLTQPIDDPVDDNFWLPYYEMTEDDTMGLSYKSSVEPVSIDKEFQQMLPDFFLSWDENDYHPMGLNAILPQVLDLSSLHAGVVCPGALSRRGVAMGTGTSSGTGTGLGSVDALPSPETFIRWMQVSALLPQHFTITPWSYYDEQAAVVTGAYRMIQSLRVKLIRHISKAVKTSTRLGLPTVRPMWSAPTSGFYNTTLLEVTDQYMVGDDIIIAPVLERDSSQRRVLLPEGQWKECDGSNEVFIGPDTVILSKLTIMSIPCFLRVIEHSND